MLVLQEGDWRREIELGMDTERITFGRDRGASYRICIGDLRVSRVQATLSKTSAGWVLIDGRLGEPSTNGVLVNGLRVEGSTPFKPGDKAVLFPPGDPIVTLEWVPEDVTEHPTAEIPIIPEIIDRRLEKIEAMTAAGLERLERRLARIEHNDRKQDNTIRRWLLGLGAACLVLGGSSLAGGTSAGLDRAIDVMLIIAGGSGTAIAVGQSRKKDDAVE